MCVSDRTDQPTRLLLQISIRGQAAFGGASMRGGRVGKSRGQARRSDGRRPARRTGTPGDGSAEELFGELLPRTPRRGRTRGSTALTSLSSRPALTRWARTQGLPVG